MFLTFSHFFAFLRFTSIYFYLFTRSDRSDKVFRNCCTIRSTIPRTALCDSLALTEATRQDTTRMVARMSGDKRRRMPDSRSTRLALSRPHMICLKFSTDIESHRVAAIVPRSLVWTRPNNRAFSLGSLSPTLSPSPSPSLPPSSTASLLLPLARAISLSSTLWPSCSRRAPSLQEGTWDSTTCSLG